MLSRRGFLGAILGAVAATSVFGLSASARASEKERLSEWRYSRDHIQWTDEEKLLNEPRIYVINEKYLYRDAHFFDKLIIGHSKRSAIVMPPEKII